MNTRILRRFNEAGIEAAAELLDAIDRGEAADVSAIMDSPSLTEIILGGLTLDIRSFADRFDAGRYLSELLEPVAYERGRDAIAKDKGLWAWLAFAWMDLLAPPNQQGIRKIGAQNKWIPDVEDYRKYYRHFLAGPYLIYQAHRDAPERAMAVLATAVERPGEVVEQFASRQEIITSASLMGAITALYYDPVKKEIKRGASSKVAGAARRLADILRQFDLTWDIYGMPSEEILDLLPSEFDRFKPA